MTRLASQEKEDLGGDLFANLEKLTNKSPKLGAAQLPGKLPGQSALSKAEHVKMGDGKYRREMVKAMRGGQH